MGLLLEEDGIKFPQMESYECSKLANVLHTKELARQLNGDNFQLSLLFPIVPFLLNVLMINKGHLYYCVFVIGTGVTVYSLHPGFIYDGMALNLSQSSDGLGIRQTLITYLLWLMKL